MDPVTEQILSQPQGWYAATTFGCTCPDAVQRGLLCKHSLALTLLSGASAIASRERAEGQARDVLDLDPDAPIPFELTPQALAALAPPALSVAADRTRPHS